MGGPEQNNADFLKSRFEQSAQLLDPRPVDIAALQRRVDLRRRGAVRKKALWATITSMSVAAAAVGVFAMTHLLVAPAGNVTAAHGASPSASSPESPSPSASTSSSPSPALSGTAIVGTDWANVTIELPKLGPDSPAFGVQCPGGVVPFRDGTHLYPRSPGANALPAPTALINGAADAPGPPQYGDVNRDGTLDAVVPIDCKMEISDLGLTRNLVAITTGADGRLHSLGVVTQDDEIFRGQIIRKWSIGSDGVISESLTAGRTGPLDIPKYRDYAIAPLKREFRWTGNGFDRVDDAVGLERSIRNGDVNLPAVSAACPAGQVGFDNGVADLQPTVRESLSIPSGTGVYPFLADFNHDGLVDELVRLSCAYDQPAGGKETAYRILVLTRGHDGAVRVVGSLDLAGLSIGDAPEANVVSNGIAVYKSIGRVGVWRWNGSRFAKVA